MHTPICPNKVLSNCSQSELASHHNTGNNAILQEHHTTCKREGIKVQNNRFWQNTMLAACAAWDTLLSKYWILTTPMCPRLFWKPSLRVVTDFTATPKSLVCCDVWNAYDVLCSDAPMTISFFLELHHASLSDVASIPVNAQQISWCSGWCQSGRQQSTWAGWCFWQAAGT